MSKFVIKPWPFTKDEEVELYWLCSPYLNNYREWMMKCVFKYNSTLKEVEIPWGTLPYLRLGKKYKNGAVSDSSGKGYPGQLKINKTEFILCTSFNMPKKLYYLYSNFNYGKEKLCKFKINSKTYYVPCIEVIRSFYAKSTTLANYLLKPNGIDFLITNNNIFENRLYIDLSSEVPKNIVTSETVAHIGWIKNNKTAYESWISVYGNMFINDNNKPDVIELIPPVTSNCTWTYRGISSDDNILMLEIIASTGIRTPFKNIMYTHPEIERNRIVESPEEYKTSKKEKDADYELFKDKDGIGTRMQHKVSVIDLKPTKFVFEDINSINRITNGEKEVILGTKIISKPNFSDYDVKHKTNKVSTENWSGDGKIPPIEFKSLEIVKGKQGKGLDDFYKAIVIVKNIHKSANISIEEVFLPKRKSFSTYSDGDRRTCAVVSIETVNKLPCYILEVGRADNWSISTLVIHQYYLWNSQENIENLIDKLLNLLIENNGHWDKHILNNETLIKFDMMHHMIGESFTNWAFRLSNKLLQY